MADDPKPDPKPDPIPDPKTDGDSLTETELRSMIGEVLDERLTTFKAEMPKGFDQAAFKAELLVDVGNLIQQNKGTAFDESGFLAKVGTLIDAKIGSATGSPISTKRKPGPLGRWLGGTA